MAKLLKNTHLFLDFASILVSLTTENTFLAFPFLSMITSARTDRWFMICFIQTFSVSSFVCALCVYTHKGKLNFVLCVHVCVFVSVVFLISNLTRFDRSPWIWPLTVVDKPIDLVVYG